ncbi:MAG: type VI secretion system lipoprotein TssJ [Azoarcus sp.]|jgi:type VI secretion system protein VasD|nr:type VI secretion system lipoprotein TssJ [Azoarcus sp.]
MQNRAEQAKSRWGLLIPVALAILAGACSKSSEELTRALTLPFAAPPEARVETVHGPEDYALKGVADLNINRDIYGKSLSVVVRVYQLRDKNEFARLSFESAASRSDSELFPKELVAVNEIVLVPGEARELVDKLLPETRYVGAVGFFRQPDAQFWRFLVNARAVRNEGLNFTLQDCYFAAIQPQPEPVTGQGAGYTPRCAWSVYPTNPPARSRR